MGGSFQTPMERECLRLLLRGTQPVVICPARSTENMRIPTDWRPGLEKGRLLVMSPFAPHQRRPTEKATGQRNNLVVSLATQAFIAHAATRGKTENFARRLLTTGKPVLTLDGPANANLFALGIRPLDSFDDFRTGSGTS